MEAVHRRNLLLLSCLVLALGQTGESYKKGKCSPCTRFKQSCIVSFLTWFSKLNEPLDEYEVVKYNEVIENIGNGYNSATGKFTAPVSGVYSMSVTMMSNATNYVHLSIMKNTQELTYLYANKGTNPQASTTLNVLLFQGDTVSVQRQKHTGGYLEAHPHGRFNIFSGALIRQI